jgi:chromatin modification-related protein VID21
MHVGIMVLIIGSGIVTSRKRKLREFFAVCDNDGPIPQINLSNVDAPPTNAAEAYFLEVTDILQYVALSICGV